MQAQLLNLESTSEKSNFKPKKQNGSDFFDLLQSSDFQKNIILNENHTFQEQTGKPENTQLPNFIETQLLENIAVDSLKDNLDFYEKDFQNILPLSSNLNYPVEKNDNIANLTFENSDVKNKNSSILANILSEISNSRLDTDNKDINANNKYIYTLDNNFIDKIDTSSKSLEFADSTFDDKNLFHILTILEFLNGGSKINNFPDLKKDLISVIDKNLNEFKNVKNFEELIKLSEKLNLIKIDFSFDKIEKLKEQFPKLNEINFFPESKVFLKDLTDEKIIKNRENVFSDKIDIENKVYQKIDENTKNYDNDSKKIDLESLLFPDRKKRNIDHADNIVGLAKKNQFFPIRKTFDSFSSSLQEAVKEYRPPLTKLNITLNPANLGEVEVKIFSRGNNLHINFNSNTQTMNLFLQNQAEFKNSLVNMGFTELAMNFSDGQNKKEQQNKKSKNLQKNKEQNQENINLELVMAKYI